MLQGSGRNYRLFRALSAIGGIAFVIISGQEVRSQSAPDSGPIIQPGQLVGGATKQVPVEAMQLRGFLPQPQLLQRGASGQFDLVYLNLSANYASYKKIFLEPVTVWAGGNSKWNNVPAAQRQALSNTLYSDLYSTLRQSCEMVKTASAGTLRMRFALVDADSPDPVMNTVASYTPYLSTAYTAASFVFNKGVGYLAGTATIAGVITDGKDGTLLWEGVDKRAGTTALVANTLDNWRDIHHAFKAWANQLQARLQQIGICKARR